MLKKLFGALASLLLIGGGLAGFMYQRDHRQPPAPTRTHQQKLQVVTTNSILADMVANVGGNKVQVYSIVNRGVDPHEYDPQPQDIRKTAESDLVFHNGLNLETGGNGWFKKLLQTTHKDPQEDVFAASKGVTPMHLTTNKNEPDPHAWLDLSNGIKYVETMTTALIKKDPANANYYRKNSAAYTAKLRQLHQRAQTKFNQLPRENRLLVTSEGAFKYFAQAYQVTPTYIWEVNTEAQGTPEQMQRVLKKIRQANVRHLFVETSVSPKSMQQVAKETDLSIYATIFTDSLAQKGKTGDTYIDMMRWNFEKIYGGMK